MLCYESTPNRHGVPDFALQEMHGGKPFSGVWAFDLLERSLCLTEYAWIVPLKAPLTEEQEKRFEAYLSKKHRSFTTYDYVQATSMGFWTLGGQATADTVAQLGNDNDNKVWPQRSRKAQL